MTVKTMKESLQEYVNLANEGDEEGAKAAFHGYARDKIRAMLYGLEESSDTLAEIAGLQFDGDTLLMDGKSIATVTVGEDDKVKLCFNESDDEYEFDSLDVCLEFVVNKKGVKEGRVEDAVLKQKAMKPMRAARWAYVRKDHPGDGTPGDYESGDESTYKDSIKDKNSGPASDGNLKVGSEGYDSHDVRTKHGDPVRGKSGEAAHNVDTDLKVGSEGYDSHDVRKQHGS
jgi:hypothetical protein